MASATSPTDIELMPITRDVEAPPRIALTSQDGWINLYVLNRIVNRNVLLVSTTHQVGIGALKALAIACSFGERLPFVRIALRYAGDNLPLGITLASCSAISFGVVVAWCLLNLIDATTKPLSLEEKQLLSTSLTPFQKVMVNTAVVTMGIFAQVPQAFMAYTYNNNNYLLFIGVIGVDSAYPIYSLHLSAQDMLRQSVVKNEFEKRLDVMRKGLVKEIKHSVSAIQNLRDDDLNELILFLNNIRQLSDDKEIVSKFLSLILSYNNGLDNRVNARCPIRIDRYAVVLLGLGLLAVQSVFNGMLSYRGTELLIDNRIVDFSVAGFVIFCNLYLTYLTTVIAALKMYDIAVSYVSCRPQKTLSIHFYPITTSLLVITSIAISALSFSGTVQVSHDYFPSLLRLPMGIASSLSYIILSIYAKVVLINQGVAAGGRRFGNQTTSEAFVLEQNVNRLIELLERAPLHESIKLFNFIPPDLQSRFLEHAGITPSAFQEYQRGPV